MAIRSAPLDADENASRKEISVDDYQRIIGNLWPQVFGVGSLISPGSERGSRKNVRAKSHQGDDASEWIAAELVISSVLTAEMISILLRIRHPDRCAVEP